MNFEQFALNLIREAEESGLPDPTELQGADVAPAMPTAPPEPPKRVTRGEAEAIRIALAALHLDPSDRAKFPVRDLTVFDKTDPHQIFATASRLTGLPMTAELGIAPQSKQMYAQLILKALKFKPQDLPSDDPVLSQTLNSTNANDIKERLIDLVNIV